MLFRSRDQSSQLEEPEEGVTPEKVKRAQKEVGELLWLVTRTRPELMFAVSKMGSATTKSPDLVHEIYKQVLGYLLVHPMDGLVFDVKAETLGFWRPLQIPHFRHKVRNPTEHSSSSSVDAPFFGDQDVNP